MPRPTFKVVGIDELSKAFRRFFDDFDVVETGTSALREVAEEIAEEAQIRAPVLTGRLKSSIEVEAVDRTGDVNSRGRSGFSVGPTRSGMPQALMQEYGTRHHSAQPFMRPAWDKHGGEAAEAKLQSSLEREFDRVARKTT